MRLHKAMQDGKCPVCESNYRSGALLLLNDDVTPTVRAGCDQCSDERVLAEMARLDATSGPPKADPPKADKKKSPPKDEPWRKTKLVWKEETYAGKRCETCGCSVEKGELVGKWGASEGGNWQIVRCKSCPDLTGGEKAKFNNTITASEATDSGALTERVGNYSIAWTLINSGDKARLNAATAAFGKGGAEALHSAMSRLALGSDALARCPAVGWLAAWDAACSSGFIPGTGGSALAYLIPRGGVSFELSYKAYHQMAHRDGVTVTEHLIWACEQALGMLARPYREALHHARRDKSRPEVMAARCEVERNAATYALNLIGRWDDMEAEAETLMGRMVRGDKFSEPPAVLSLLARAMRLDGIQREMAICIAARMLAAEAAARVLRDDAVAAQKSGKAPTFSDDDDAVIAALRIPETQGSWVAYDWYYALDEDSAPLYNRPPEAAWMPPAPRWVTQDKRRVFLTWPVTGFAVARWRHDGGNQSASIRMDGVEVHKRAVRGQNAAIEPGGGLSAPEGKSPWASDYEAMFKKTLDRTLFTSGKVPLSNQMERVMATDGDGADVLGTIEVSSLQELAARQIEAMRSRRQLTDGGPPGEEIEASPVMQYEEIPF